MKILEVCLVLALIGGGVVAESCSTYFTAADERRNQILTVISSLELSASRFKSSTNYMIDDIDNLDSGENLTSLSDSFKDLYNKKNDVVDDMSDLSTKIDNYDGKISASRSGLPNACYNVFTSYDRDLNDFMDYYRSVNKKWSVAKSRYDTFVALNSNPASHTASQARPLINDLDDAAQDFEDVIGDTPARINSTTTVPLMNQSDCFNMIKKNVEIGISDCNKACNAKIASLNVTTQGICNPPSDYQTTKSMLVTCQNDYSNLAQSCKTTCPTQQACPSQDVLNTKVSNLTLENEKNVAKLAAVSAQYEALKKENDACKGTICESCTMYKVAAVVLLILIIAAWIIRM